MEVNALREELEERLAKAGIGHDKARENWLKTKDNSWANRMAELAGRIEEIKYVLLKLPK